MKYRQMKLVDDIFVDSFAGGGGASTGIELATGHPVDIAINHDASAIMMHKKNHPFTEHYQEDVFGVDPVKAVRGRHVRLAWFSPDCKHFSRAKGAALVDKKIRGLAWIVLRWAGTVRPDVIMLENVPEFVTWGPVRKGKPIKSKAGQTYRKWYQQLSDLGYRIESKELCAADYGAPTIRKRFCLIARCDGNPIVFPERTHAPRDSEEVKSGKCKPWRSAAEIIDWSLPCYSIFASKEEIKQTYGATVMRPLKDNTMRRIARGLDKFVLKSKEPFIVPYIMSNNTNNAPHGLTEPIPTLTTGNRNFLISPTLIQYHTEQNEKEARGQELTEPLKTVDTQNRYGLSAVHLTQYFSGDHYHSLHEPLATVTTREREAVTAVHLSHFKGQDKGQDVRDPLMSITARDGQFAEILTVIQKYDENTPKNLGYWRQIRDMLNKYCGYDIKDDEILLIFIGQSFWYLYDIGLRMLSPRELYDAMGFPSDYVIDRDEDGNTISRADQVARCGNAVCPAVAEAMVRANINEVYYMQIPNMEALHNVMCS